MEPTVPLDWSALTSREQNDIARAVACPLCLARPQQRCSPKGDNDPAGEYNVWNLNETFHRQREAEAEHQYRAQRRAIRKKVHDAEVAMADEVARTCPWCGFLAPSHEELTAHEAGCDG